MPNTSTQIIDLGSPPLSQGSTPGCPHTQTRCTSACSPWSTCDATRSTARCRCHPGYSGLTCSLPTVPSTFYPGGFVKYSLAFQPSYHHSLLQLRFRSRKPYGELIRLIDQHHREYIILEPFKRNQTPLGTSRLIAERRFHALESKFPAQPHFHELYTEFTNEYDSLWHMEKELRTFMKPHLTTSYLIMGS
ncbi:beta-catenin binding [Homalodisca vitripennis]|nr:beta-catenin binding [Homalodisca vitripennis]